MIKVKAEFSVSTRYVHSEIREIVEIQVYPEDDMTESDIDVLIDEELDEAYNAWMWNKIFTNIKEISREEVEEE